MAGFHVALVPIGKLDVAEVEAAAQRATKVLRQPLELREVLPPPHPALDPGRGQYRAASALKLLGGEVAKLKPGKWIGDGGSAPLRPDAFIFVTDVDLFTAKTEGVLAALSTPGKCAIVSVRRLREAFHNRRSNPVRQRDRLVKELLRMWARLRGLPQCGDPECLLAPSRGCPDIDSKEERFCRVCEQNLFEGTMRL